MGVISLLVFAFLCTLVQSHGYLSDPPARFASTYASTGSVTTYLYSTYGTSGTYPFNGTTLQTCGANDQGRPANAVPRRYVGGSSIVVSWTITNPHPGAQERIRIALSTTNPYNFTQYILVDDNTPGVSGSDDYNAANETVFSRRVQLPAITCTNCVLQWVWDSGTLGGWIDCADVELYNGCDGKICYALDECYNPGNCQAPFGNCTNPKKQDGTKCTVGQCLSGVCTPPVSTPAASFNLTGIVTRYTTVDPAPWCVDQQLCPTVPIPTQTERLAWVLINSARVGLLSFTNRYGFTPCGTSRRVARPLWWDTGLQQSARFHVEEMTNYDPCFQDDTCPALAYLFNNSADWRDRINFFTPNTTQDGIIVTARADYIGSDYPDPLHMVMWWFHGADLTAAAGPSWRCDGLMDDYTNSGATSYKYFPPSRYVNFWTVPLGNGNGFGWNGRLWINALYGGGSHMIYNNKLRFIVNYYSKTIPQMVQVVVDGAAYDMAYHTGNKVDGVLFGLTSNVGSYYVDLPLPGSTAGCSSYYFMARNADATFRFPEVGRFQTFNVSSCLEDYNSTTVDGEFIPIPGAPYMMNFTIFGYDPNKTLNWDTFRYELAQEYQQTYGQQINMFAVRTFRSADNTTGWAIMFASERTTNWPIPAYKFADMTKNHAVARVNLAVTYNGGLQADFLLTTAPFDGKDATADTTTANVIAASVLVAVISVGFIVIVALKREALLGYFAEKTKDWTLEKHCYIVAGIVFVTWLINVISQGSDWWASSSGDPNSNIGLWKVCVNGACQDSLQTSATGRSVLKACRALMLLAQFGGVVGWIAPIVISRKFLESAKTPIAWAVAISLFIMFVFTFLSVALFMAYFSDVLLPQPTTSFMPNWSWVLGCVSMFGALVGACYAFPLTNKSEEAVKAVETTKASGETGPKKVGDWEKLWDDNNKAWYFYNHKTAESTWDPPTGF